MNKLQKESIKLYQEKIDWAKIQNPHTKPNLNKMFNAINHNWSGTNCPYCYKYQDLTCSACPLGTSHHCCGGLWQKMNKTQTWKKWIYYAKQIIKYIKIYG